MTHCRFLLLTCLCLLPLFTWAQEAPRTPAEYLEAGRKAFANKQFHTAQYYADNALADSTTARQAAEIRIQCMSELMTTPVDSSRFLIACLELHHMEPSNPVFMRLLMNYFTSPNHRHEILDFANDEIRRDSDNQWAWVLRGEYYMRRSEWTSAISDFERAVNIDTAFAEAVYDIGVCRVGMAKALGDSIEKDNQKPTKEQAELLRERYAEALPYLEKALPALAAPAPCEALLLQVYRATGLRQKARALEEKRKKREKK